MSYEGYVQHQCALGHVWNVDVFVCEFETKPICPQCQGLAVWTNQVDLTNGSYDDNGDRIDGYLEPPIPEFIKYPKIPRLSRNCIITEKIDGTNAQICITPEFEVFAGSRSRWLTPGKTTDNYGFAEWVQNNKEALIKELGVGRHFGE